MRTLGIFATLSCWLVFGACAAPRAGVRKPVPLPTVENVPAALHESEFAADLYANADPYDPAGLIALGPTRAASADPQLALEFAFQFGGTFVESELD